MDQHRRQDPIVARKKKCYHLGSCLQDSVGINDFAIVNSRKIGCFHFLLLLLLSNLTKLSRLKNIVGKAIQNRILDKVMLFLFRECSLDILRL